MNNRLSTEYDVTLGRNVHPGAAVPSPCEHGWEESCPHCMRAEIERLRRALGSVSTQCGNVIYNCQQRPADNNRHLSSWRGVKEYADAILKETPQ